MEINLVVHPSQTEEIKIQKFKTALENLGFEVRLCIEHIFQSDFLKKFNFRKPTIIIFPLNFFNYNNCMTLYNALNFFQQKLVVLSQTLSEQEQQNVRRQKRNTLMLLATTIETFLSFDRRHQQAWLRMRLQRKK